MLECFDCKRVAFLIQGSCDECEPELHRAYKENQQAYDDIRRLYIFATGRDPLDDWYAFEAWVEAQRA